MTSLCDTWQHTLAQLQEPGHAMPALTLDDIEEVLSVSSHAPSLSFELDTPLWLPPPAHGLDPAWP